MGLAFQPEVGGNMARWRTRRVNSPSATVRCSISAAKKRARGDGAGRSLAQRHVRRTSHLIVKLDERELVRRTRSAARQAARRFDWADIDQVDNKRASCERPRYSHGPAAAWESLAKPWGSLQPVFPSDAYTASGRKTFRASSNTHKPGRSASHTGEHSGAQQSPD